MSEIKRRIAKYIGIFLLLSGLAVLGLTYFPVFNAYIDSKVSPISSEAKIEVSQTPTEKISEENTTIFVDENFGIYIPKIKANAKVIENVDPENRQEYELALEKGVAHAKGTPLPSQEGNVFLFAHSARNFYESRKLNVYFYLLDQLKKDDTIYVSYNYKIYTYKVLETKIVSRYDVQYMGKISEEDTLTLMACWPAGTDWRRVIVIAQKEK